MKKKKLSGGNYTFEDGAFFTISSVESILKDIISGKEIENKEKVKELLEGLDELRHYAERLSCLYRFDHKLMEGMKNSSIIYIKPKGLEMVWKRLWLYLSERWQKFINPNKWTYNQYWRFVKDVANQVSLNRRTKIEEEAYIKEVEERRRIGWLSKSS